MGVLEKIGSAPLKLLGGVVSSIKNYPLVIALILLVVLPMILDLAGVLEGYYGAQGSIINWWNPTKWNCNPKKVGQLAPVPRTSLPDVKLTGQL
jgi:hypothetical protein